MSSFLNTIKAIFIKDLLSELRSKQTLPAVIILSVLIAWIFRVAADSASTDKSVIAAAALLISLLFSVILVAERIFAVEQQNDCISALLLAPVDSGNIYIAKLLVNLVMLCIFEIIAVPVVFVLFKINVDGRWLDLLIVLLLLNLSVAGVGTLLGCMVQSVKATSSLLSILVLAVLCPLIIPAVFALLSLFGGLDNNIAATDIMAFVGDFKKAVRFLAAFAAVFVTVSWLLFDYVVSE